MPECVFCNIINKKADSTRLIENEGFLAIMDINPIAPGHTLIISKEHYKDILELPNNLAPSLVEIIKNVSKLMMDNLGCDGINLINSTGRSAGQTIFHFHVHVIPRFTGKSIGFQEWWFSRAGHWDRESLNRMANEILGNPNYKY
mgnify:CR=1 FL=1